MPSCLFGAAMPFRCEIWTETLSQDEFSGQFIRLWELDATVNCNVESVESRGRNGSDLEVSSKQYKYERYVYITVSNNVKENARISNVRTKSGILVFDEKNDDPTIFEIIGKTPALDQIFGGILGYKLLCNRAEVQDNA